MKKQIKNENGIELNLILETSNEITVEFVRNGAVAASSQLQKANEFFKKSKNWASDFYLSAPGQYIPVKNETAAFIKAESAKFLQENAAQIQINNQILDRLAREGEKELAFENSMAQAGFSAGDGFGKIDRLNKFDGNKF